LASERRHRGWASRGFELTSGKDARVLAEVVFGMSQEDFSADVQERFQARYRAGDGAVTHP